MPGRSMPPVTGQRRGGGSRGSSRASGDVEKAVRSDLAEIALRDERLAGSALAASAVALAREIDDPGNSATSKSMCAKALLETLDRLRSLAPQEEANDKLDELATRRSARVAAS